MNDLKANRGILGMNESLTDAEYNVSNCLSYSKIKDVYDNPETLTKERVSEDKEWLVFGTLVDMILTQPPEEFEKRVLVNDKVPSDQYKNIIQYYVDMQYTTPLESLTNEDIETLYSNSGSDVKWLPDTKRKKLIENGVEYLKLITEHKDKLIVTVDVFNEAMNIAEVFRTHKWTKELFMSKQEQEENNIELYYQFKIKYIYEDLWFQSKLDIVKIDHDFKIISIYDIKTGIDAPRMFTRSALYKYKYIYQSVLYNEGMDAFISNISSLRNYSLDNFRFIYISRLKPTYPIILQISQEAHMEILNTGIDDRSYFLPSLTDITEAVQFYVKEIDEGKIPTIPRDIDLVFGEKKIYAYSNSPNLAF